MPPDPTRIYLDNAATSWPKPDSVLEAMDRYQRKCGVAAGRGGYRDAESVERSIAQTRQSIAKLIGATSSNHVVFGQNCTDALNVAVHGLLRAGDHVITSAAEHNSILRPLAHLSKHRDVSVATVCVDSDGLIDPQQLSTLVNPKTRLIAITHASNVTGALQPIEQIGRLARAHGCLFLLDAAQTLGHFPIDVEAQHVDLLAAAGHKGLLGPLGTGVLYIADGLEEQIESLRQGGTGTQSELPEQPETMPAKYEAGNLNVPGILGLAAGVRYVADNQLCESDHLIKLSRHLVDAFRDSAGVMTYSRPNHCGIVSFNVDGYDPREVATLLDGSAGIQVRAGLHCAPLMHQSLGTFATGGTVRASCGHFSNMEEIEKLIESVRMLAANPMT